MRPPIVLAMTIPPPSNAPTNTPHAPTTAPTTNAPLPPLPPQATGVIDDSKLEAAHLLLRPFLLRRIKSEVECRLPPKVETRINCPLSEFQTVRDSSRE